MVPIKDIGSINTIATNPRIMNNVSCHISNLLVEVIERLDAINNRNERVEKYMMERDRIYDERMSKYDDMNFEQVEADSSPTVNVAGEPIRTEFDGSYVHHYGDNIGDEDDEF